MIYEQGIVHKLYKKLLTLYPRAFKEQLGESMEQTFQDLWNEKRQTQKGLFGFVLWTFIETAIGIFRERLLLISEGGTMPTTLGTIGSSGAISFLLILPFAIMEVINRRNFNEGFPILLFFGLWLNLFAISLILLPIMQARWTRKHDAPNPVPIQGNTRLTNPRSALMISVLLVLSVVIFSLLVFIGWEPMQRLLNNPNPEQLSVFMIRVPSQLIALVLLALPVLAGISASGPIIRTLRAGGSLFAHLTNLIIVAVILSTFAIGFANLLVDQWPCFIGVPNCD